MPQPTQGGGKGRTLGIAVGALVVVGAVIGGFLAFSGDDGDGSGSGGVDIADDGKRYKLATPRTLLDDFTRTEESGSAADFSEADRRKIGVTGGKGVQSSYTADKGGGYEFILLFGAYGEVADPEKSADGLFTFMEQDEGTDFELVGSRETMTSEGSGNGVMKCQTMRIKGEPEPGMPAETPMCVWADSSTVAAVTWTQGEGAPSMDDAARTAADVRGEARVRAD